MKDERFWHIRAANYDKLYWTKDKSFLQCIIQAGKFGKKDIVLDVGTGTGIVAKALKPRVKHVVGLDISSSMLEQGRWDGFSVIKLDIADLLFANNVFDKVVARLVFHHITDNLNRAVLRCYDLLKDKGFLVVAEGIPPAEDKDVLDWYTHMFSYKEKRRTFTSRQLIDLLAHNGFINVRSVEYIMKRFSIKNWLVNSGLDEDKQRIIMDLHLKAPRKIKELYDMKILKRDCLINTKNIIVIGQKKENRGC